MAVNWQYLRRRPVCPSGSMNLTSTCSWWPSLPVCRLVGCVDPGRSYGTGASCSIASNRASCRGPTRPPARSVAQRRVGVAAHQRLDDVEDHADTRSGPPQWRVRRHTTHAVSVCRRWFGRSGRRSTWPWMPQVVPEAGAGPARSSMRSAPRPHLSPLARASVPRRGCGQRPCPSLPRWRSDHHRPRPSGQAEGRPTAQLRIESAAAIRAPFLAPGQWTCRATPRAPSRRCRR
jgi:hypothetical protein